MDSEKKDTQKPKVNYLQLYLYMIARGGQAKERYAEIILRAMEKDYNLPKMDEQGWESFCLSQAYKQ